MPHYKISLGFNRHHLEKYFDQVLENFVEFERESLSELEADKIFESSVDDLISVFVLTRSLPLKFKPTSK